MKSVLFFIFLCCLSSTAFADSEFTFKSENPKLQKELSAYFNHLKDSNENAEEKISSYLRRHGYHLAQIKIDKNQVEISNSNKWEFFFEGNSFYSRHFFQKRIENSTLNASNENFADELKQIVLKEYKKNGFHFVNVKTSEKNTSNPFLKRLEFNIKENRIVHINKILISGELKPFSQKKILKKIKTYSGENITKGIYNEADLLSGISSLKNDMNNLGFFNSIIDLESIDFNKRKNGVLIRIKVFTNKPTLIKKISFVGQEKISDFWLKEILGLKEGDKLNLYSLETGLDLVEDYYLQRGFLKVQIDKNNILKYSKDLRSASIKIPLKEDVQVLVSKIIVRNKGLKTKPSIIKRELAFKEGEVLTVDKVNQSLNNLNNLGYLSNININVLFDQKGPDGIPVEITLSERKSGAVTTGFGLSSELDLTVKTFAGFDYKNIRGTGRSLFTRLELDRTLRNIDRTDNRLFLSYLEPYLFESSFKGRINLSRNDEILNIDSSRDFVTIIDSNRLDFVVEKNLTKRTFLHFALFSLDRRREREVDDGFQEIREFIGSISPRIELDYRNHPFLPTKGFFTRFEAEYASPLLGSTTKSTEGDFDLEYLKLQSTHTFYKSIKKDLIFAQSFGGGYIYNFSNRSCAPFPKSRAFFLGGPSTIRGFDPSRANERIPSDLELEADKSGCTTGLGSVNSTGGRTLSGGVLNIPGTSHYYLSKTELRFPLARQSNWWGALFYDGGSVQISDQKLDRWRHSIGFGLRYNTPVGSLINIELGYKLDRNTSTNEDAFRVHLSVSSF